MSTLSKITFAFHAGLGQYFLFTGSLDNPAEINNVTPSVHEGIIAAYLVKPGVLKAPDGSEFLLELTLLPAFREAKQRLLDEAQAKITEANALVQPAPVEDVAWMADLTNADKQHMQRVVAARRNGQRVSYSYTKPFEFRTKLGPAPAKKKAPRAATTRTPEEAMTEHKQDLVGAITMQPPVERVPVVVVKLAGEGDRSFIMERSKWDHYSKEAVPSGRTWLDVCKENFCREYFLMPDAVVSIDFDQTRTCEELDNIPGIL